MIGKVFYNKYTNIVVESSEKKICNKSKDSIK